MAQIDRFKFVVILARQRSGTNYLRSLLASSGIFFDCNEIFHEVGSDIDSCPKEGRSFNFYRFRTLELVDNPELSVPTHENINNLFARYLCHLQQVSPEGKILLLDIKYNSICSMTPVWHSPLARPYLFELLSFHNIPVIHLQRENLFNTYLSSVVAEKTKTFLYRTGDPIEFSPVTIEIEKMLLDLALRKREIQLIRECLFGLTVVELSYESFADGDRRSIEYLQKKLNSELGVDLERDLKSEVKRIIPSAKQVVANWLEVAAALRNSEFSELLD